MNLAMLNHVRRQWNKEHPMQTDLPVILVTKQSGQTGGFDEKAESAAISGAKLLVIGHPEETSGLSLPEAFAMLKEYCGKDTTELKTPTVPEKYCDKDMAKPAEPESQNTPRTISLIGLGMYEGQLTLEADHALRQCDVIIGAKRMLTMTKTYHKPCFCSYDYPAIAEYMKLHTEYCHFAVLFSGDIGFYSGASRLRQCLKGLPFKIQTFSGIASPVHFLNAIGKTWEDVYFISRHGQTPAIISCVCQHIKTLILLGKPEDVSDICKKLTGYGMSDVDVTIGACLCQPEEQIFHGKPADFTGQNFPALSVMYIENPDAKSRPVTHGLPDDSFIRGKVPMTKSEIRSVVLSKLALTPDAIFYDIGAGTGSVAIEAARQIPNGQVCAIERNSEGVALIQSNSCKLQTDNFTVIEGTAPECLTGLPSATHAFIGGSGGHLTEIIRYLYSTNTSMRIVITAITLETISGILDIQEELTLPEPDIIQLQVNAAKKAGSSHMMLAQNPVYIITLNAFSVR